MAGAGALDKRVTFQTPGKTPDGQGGNVVGWANVLTVWGEFVPERGAERLEAGRLQEAAAGILRIRSSSASRAIGPSHRVLIAGIAHQVRSIADPDNQFRELVVERGVAS
jgi:SPP1 family predicted phage head-tail adaptor